VIEFNRAAALAMLRGPRSGLEELERVRSRAGPLLERYPWAHALRGELELRCRRPRAAARAFERALEYAGSAAERRFLARRRAACEEGD
jgi:RNA polymerase sigma-70 factor (ECF subfamily)